MAKVIISLSAKADSYVSSNVIGYDMFSGNEQHILNFNNALKSSGLQATLLLPNKKHNIDGGVIVVSKTKLSDIDKKIILNELTAWHSDDPFKSRSNTSVSAAIIKDSSRTPNTPTLYQTHPNKPGSEKNIGRIRSMRIKSKKILALKEKLKNPNLEDNERKAILSKLLALPL